MNALTAVDNLYEKPLRDSRDEIIHHAARHDVLYAPIRNDTCLVL